MKRTIALCLSFIILASLLCTASVFASYATPNETIEAQINDLLSEFASCVYELDSARDLASLFIEDSDSYADYYLEKTELFFGIPTVYGNSYSFVDTEVELQSIEITEKGDFKIKALICIKSNQNGNLRDTAYEEVEYNFTIVDIDGELKLSSAFSHDALDTILPFYSAEERIQYLTEKYVLTKAATDEEMDRLEAYNMCQDKMRILTRSATAYNRTDAVNYATTYWSSYNSSFGSFSADCQNFASQCVWCGYGGTTVPTTASSATTPMVYNYNSSHTRDWYHAKSGYSVAASPSWKFTSKFMEYILNSSTYVRGPMGWVYDRTSICLKYAMPGDIIHVYWKDEIDYPTDLPDHAYVVVSTENPYGYNDLSTIIVAAHTTNHNNYSLKKLSNVGYSEDEFALIRIASWQSGS